MEATLKKIFDHIEGKTIYNIKTPYASIHIYAENDLEAIGRAEELSKIGHAAKRIIEIKEDLVNKNELYSELIRIYQLGFKHELNKQDIANIYSGLAMRAYALGKLDALVGDDVRAVDYQSNEEILERILLN